MLNYLYAWVSGRLSLEGEEGQTAVEYAMVVALVAIVVAGALAAGAAGMFAGFWDDITDLMGL